MSVELEELFHDLDAPTMSVSADSVVASGQRKVRRRRALWGAGTGALAAAAAVAIAVGTALPDSSSTSPMPAHSSSAVALGSFFLHAGQDGGRATDRVTSTPMGKTNGADPTPSTTYQIYRYDGVLRIRKLAASGSADLPATARFADGGSAANDRDQTVIVRPVPRDTRTAEIWFNPSANYDMSSTGAVMLPDGTTAAVFWTGRRIEASSGVGDVTWWTTAGTLRSSTGATATTVPLAHAAGTTTTFWYFESLARCGVVMLSKDGSSGGADTSHRDGVCGTNFATGDRQVWAVLTPGPISNVSAPPTSTAPAPPLHQTAVGTHVLLWTETASGHTPYKYVSWDSPKGERISWPD